MILAAYIVPALFVLARFRKVILSSRGALAFFALGLGLFVVAGAFDVIGVGIDELVEPLAAACIVGGFTRIALGSRGVAVAPLSRATRIRSSPCTGSRFSHRRPSP